MTEATKTDVFKFVSVRSPQSIDQGKIDRYYIQDVDVKLEGNKRRVLREVFSASSYSMVGKIVYKKIFCGSAGKTKAQINEEIIQEVLNLVDIRTAQCEEDGIIPDNFINELESKSYYFQNDQYYLLPEKLSDIPINFDTRKLTAVQNIIREHCASFDRKDLLAAVNKALGVDTLDYFVFNNDGLYSVVYSALRYRLFEMLYTLYIIRRKTPVVLEEVMQGLQILHVMEFLAIDEFLAKVYSKEISVTQADGREQLQFLRSAYPELTTIKLESNNRFYFIKNKHDLADFFQAKPLIHPIIAELAWYGKGKFNTIKPYLGDLKVVKQWLSGYKVGEISHIHNIMKSEIKTRDFRYLEKTESEFSVSSESSQSTQSEAQSTDRFELKKEVESVVKNDLKVGANLSTTFKYGEVFSANLGTNFSYQNSVQDSQRLASNFVHEVMNKAITNIQSSRSERRSITKIYETEEKNIHTFENTAATAQHISGIYRWLDKKYKAQLYNYGKRWMFEFIIPEPAAFYVKAKLKAAEFNIPALKKPNRKIAEPATVFLPGNSQTPLTAAAINSEEIFDALRANYDLSEFSFPMRNRLELLVDKLTGKSVFSHYFDPPKDAQFISEHFDVEFEAQGYEIEGIVVSGEVRFWDQASESAHWSERNIFALYVNGRQIKYSTLPTGGPLVEAIKDVGEGFNLNSNKIDVTNGRVSIGVEGRDMHYFNLNILASLEIKPSHLLSWQIQVFNKIHEIERKKVEKVNQDYELEYSAQLSEYQNALDGLSAQVVNDLIQGRSEAFNSAIIKEELKKHCITMIAKEFDLDSADDILSGTDAIGDEEVDIEYEKFEVNEVSTILEMAMSDSGEKETRVVAQYNDVDDTLDYPKIHLDNAAKKARYVQFLEQAFEWENISYIFYPYFWAHESKWVKLMNRLDYTDSNMTAFLKAGSSRVLIAVTPGYKDAVMHFLATREPWDGGPLPVIDDPLFVPLYEEIRQQQDDLLNAVPEGTSWDFEIPTTLVYLQDSSSPIPSDLIPPN